MEYMSNDYPGSGVSEYIVTVKTQFGYIGKNSAANWERRSQIQFPGTSRPKISKPTVLLTGAEVTQERVDYSTDKQASNCEGVYYKPISTFQ